MAKRTYRRPVAYNSLSSRQLNSLAGKDFHIAEFHGINDDENFVSSDQVSFSDCNNLYIDSDGQLRQRPVINESDYDGSVLSTQEIDGILFIWIVSGDNKTLYVRNPATETYLNTEVSIGLNDKYLITPWDNLYVIFVNDNIYGIEFVDDGLKKYNTSDLVYIPIKRVSEGGLVEDENIFTNLTKKVFIFSESIHSFTDELVGKEVIIPVGDSTVKAIWQTTTEKVLIEILNYKAFDDIQRKGNTWLGIVYANKDEKDRNVSVYISHNGKTFESISPPNGLSFEVEGKTYDVRCKYVLSDDGSTIFLFSNSINTYTGYLGVGEVTDIRLWHTDTSMISWIEEKIENAQDKSAFSFGVIDTNFMDDPEYHGNLLGFFWQRAIVQEYIRGYSPSDPLYGSTFQKYSKEFLANAPSPNFAACLIPINFFVNGVCATNTEFSQTQTTAITPKFTYGFIIIVYDGSIKRFWINSTSSEKNFDSLICVNRKVYFNSGSTLYGFDVDNVGTNCWQTWTGLFGDVPDCGYYSKDIAYAYSKWARSFDEELMSAGSNGIKYGSATTSKQMALVNPNQMDNWASRTAFERVRELDTNKTRVDTENVKFRVELLNEISLAGISGTILRFNKQYVATTKGLFTVASGQFADWLINPDNVYYLDEAGEFEYYSSGVTYTSVLSSTIEITIIDKLEGLPDYNFIIPSFVESFITKTLSYESSLYQSTQKDNKIYVPKTSKVSISNTVTGLIKLTDTSLGVFTETATYLYDYSESYTQALSVNSFTLTKSKIAFGLRRNSNVKYSIDGQYILLTTPKGLTALTYQQFVYTTEQTYTYLSESIMNYYSEWCNHYKNSVRITNYRNWIVLWQEMNNTIWLLDLRNSSWWKWTLPVGVKDMETVDNTLYINLSNALCKFDFGNFISYKDTIKENKYSIPIFAKSQKLHFSAPVYYKHIKSFTSIVNRETSGELEVLTYNLTFWNYRNGINTTDKETVSFDANGLITQIQPVNFVKTNAFQFQIEVNEELSNVQFSLSDIVIKYRVTEAIR